MQSYPLSTAGENLNWYNSLGHNLCYLWSWLGIYLSSHNSTSLYLIEKPLDTCTRTQFKNMFIAALYATF